MHGHSSNQPPSPCDGTCRIEAVSGWCQGCGRTLNEIADWPMLTPRERRAVLAQLPGRSQARTA